MILPPEAASLLEVFAPLFTQPTFHRFVTLLAGVLLTPGRRTVANVLRTLGLLAPGHPASYRRVLSAARGSGVELGGVLAGFLLKHFVPDGPVALVGDDTVDGHPGRHVYGKARHRDPVRSSHSYTAWRYGHKWVVLAVLVRFPGTTRPWALPILVDLYRTAEDDRRRERTHRTPARLMCRLLRLVLLRFPDRRFTFVGDAGYGTHEVARFCHRHRDRLALVNKLHPDANLFTPPPPYTGKGRPRVKGDRLPKPREAVAGAKRLRRLTVGWYGGDVRRVGTKSGLGHWYKAGQGLVPIRWVFVRDLTGTHRDEYFFTTDPARTPTGVIEPYCGRWNIETTFQECRSCLGSESTRGWCQATVLRAAPCLFGLYSVVAALYHLLPEDKRVGRVDWPGKAGVTFSDAVTTVRRRFWDEGVFSQAFDEAGVKKLTLPLREFLLNRLAMAA
ncbi:IS701 family transposase [Zavarzinella formosa]|uniref:IS701 family transposase n=1 Tax=Zavarzinella formosa TaxID=360055 RepID=UPI0002FB853A|nr:transposase [Zavarzinella formosa]